MINTWTISIPISALTIKIVLPMKTPPPTLPSMLFSSSSSSLTPQDAGRTSSTVGKEIHRLAHLVWRRKCRTSKFSARKEDGSFPQDLKRPSKPTSCKCLRSHFIVYPLTAERSGLSSRTPMHHVLEKMMRPPRTLDGSSLSDAVIYSHHKCFCMFLVLL